MRTPRRGFDKVIDSMIVCAQRERKTTKPKGQTITKK